MALYRCGTPAHRVVHGSHDGSGRPSDTSYLTVTTGRTVLQHDIALLRSRLSVSDTAQLTRPEQESISTATDYKNDGDAHRHSLNSTCDCLCVSLRTECLYTSYIRRKARAWCTRRQTELSVGGIRVSGNKQQTD